MRKASVEQYLKASKLLQGCEGVYQVRLGNGLSKVKIYDQQGARAVTADLINKLDQARAARQKLKNALKRISKAASLASESKI